MKDKYQYFWKRNLPHVQPENTPLFVNYSLKVNLSDEIKKRVHAQKVSYKFDSNFFVYDQIFDKHKSKENYLIIPEIADMVFESILYLQKYGDLHAFTIMPNHIHLLLSLKSGHSLSYLMQNHKRFTSRKANIILNREGKFWNKEYYDHYIRDDIEFYAIAWYIINNPVSANLVLHWKQWKYTWISEELSEQIGEYIDVARR
ncbi:MAG: transposase [Candidatus Cloacimonetes bacterium]|nr:transposase [Candidatus Cloacimonadota bacterium]